MSRTARALAIACLLGAPDSGCSETPLTQLVVVVDSDWDGFERVEIEIEGFGDDPIVNAGDLHDDPLPRRVALVHEGGPLGPLTITVRGYAMGIVEPVLIEPRSGVRFERDRTRMLKIDLLYDCIGWCREGEACVEGPTCLESDDDRVIGLDPWSGDVNGLDAIYKVAEGHGVGRRERDGGPVIVPVRDASPPPDGEVPPVDVDTGSGGSAGSDTGPGEVDTGPVMSTPTFGYAPANFDPAAEGIAVPPRVAVVLNCDVSEFDSRSLTFSNWCGPEPTPVVIDQFDGTDAAVLVMDTLTIAAGATLRLVGDRPVILAVFGDVVIAGTIDASARGPAPGPGADRICAASPGSTGGNSANSSGAGGGSGGGFASPGGDGGRGGAGQTAAPAAVTGGAVAGNSTLTPLRGGCSGGRGGNGPSTSSGAIGGGGGGAVQISAAGRLDLDGLVTAAGGGGGISANVKDGGGGGGSGGAVLLEGDPLDVDGAAVISANGGSGGAGQAATDLASGSTAGSDGSTGQEAVGGGIAAGSGGNGGAGAARSSEAAAGSSGSVVFNEGGGGGGGGGGVGRIRLNQGDTCAARGVFSPPPSIGCDSCGVCPLSPALGCDPIERGGRIYYLCNDPLGWDAAHDRCVGAQMELVRIEDQPENDWLAGTIGSATWIGASDAAGEGNWIWAGQQSPFWIGDEAGGPVDAAFESWDVMEPNGLITSHDCAVLEPNGAWRDQTCADPHPYVCEP